MMLPVLRSGRTDVNIMTTLLTRQLIVGEATEGRRGRNSVVKIEACRDCRHFSGCIITIIYNNLLEIGRTKRSGVRQLAISLSI